MVTSFYQLPSWLFYLDLEQILSLYAYIFSFALVESAVTLGLVLVIDLTFFRLLRPSGDFQSRSLALLFTLLGCSMLRLGLLRTVSDIDTFLSTELLWWSTALLLAVCLAVLVSRYRRLMNFLDALADRATVLLFFYLPVSFVSLVVVALRNIL